MKHKPPGSDRLPNFTFHSTRKKPVPMAALIVITLTILSVFLIVSLLSPSSSFRYYTNPTTLSPADQKFDSLQKSLAEAAANPNSTEDEATINPHEDIETSAPRAKTEDAANSSSPTLPIQNQEKNDPELPEEEDSPGTTESKWPDPPQGGQAPAKPDKTGQPTPAAHDSKKTKTEHDEENCDLFTGEWVPNPEAPYYTNATCYRIQDHQNCMKYGRPDTDFLKWRWKPDGCELPIFDPHQFLELVRGKSIAFVGDSVGRNHMQSLMCLLSSVVYPVDLSPDENSQYQHWFYKDYNLNISMFWTPYLVSSQIIIPGDVTSPYNLYLDEFDESWTSRVETSDYIIISAAQWFFRPTMLYENRTLIGCTGCNRENVTQFSAYFPFEKAFRTCFRAINSLKKFKGVTFLRTVTPSHFEGGVWDQGGDCVRKRPYKRNETVLEDFNVEMRRIQMQELKTAQENGRERGLRFRLFDATQTMLLRPDGHPSKYGHWPHQKISNDCVHWCLPGPIDALNDLLLELFKRENK